MNSDFNLVLQRLGQCSTPDDVILFWANHRDLLRTCRMIQSVPGAASARVPARNDFEGGGFLRSLFAHDRLMFFDDATIGDMLTTDHAQIPIGYSITFDLNAVNYIAVLIRQKNIPILRPMVQAMQHITRGQFNYDASLYFWENSADTITDAKKEKMRQNLIAWETFKTIDTKRFLATAEIIPTASEQTINDSVDAVLSGYLRFLDSDLVEMVLEMYRPVYAILLKLAIIELSMGCREPAKQVEALLGFMHRDLGCIFLRELMLGCQFFLHGPSKYQFFRRIQPNQKDILNVLKNMAWDLVAIRRMERYPDDLPEGQKRYFLTYLLTFDRGLAELFDFYPLRSLIYVDGLYKPMGFPVFDALGFLRDQCGLSSQVLTQYFSLDAMQARQIQHGGAKGGMKELIAEMETEVSRLVH